MAAATVRALCGLLHDLTGEEILVLTDSGNRPALKAFLAEDKQQRWFKVSYDQSCGLEFLIRRALRSKSYTHPNITQESFPIRGTGIRLVKARVVAYCNHESNEQAAQRLMDAGYLLGNAGDLASFLYQYPDVLKRWYLVDALSEDSCWADATGCVHVPYARVAGVHRHFSLEYSRHHHLEDGVLVLCE